MRISDWSSDVCSSDLTSFGLALDLDTIEMLKETDPDTYWQSAHYEGWPAVLVRYDSSDPEHVRAMIERSREWTAAKPKVRPRKRKAEKGSTSWRDRVCQYVLIPGVAVA